MNRMKFLILVFGLISLNLFGQKNEKLSGFFGDPIIADSTSTIMIPLRYNADVSSGNKLALWNDYYANIIFYDFKTDSTKKLFTQDTFIEGFIGSYRSFGYSDNTRKGIMSDKWIFYFVKNIDFDENGRIDRTDPSVLFLSDKKGNGLKAITPEFENAVSIDILNKQGIALIKMQRDLDNDKNFEYRDKDYYYVRLDLNTLKFGRKIEIKE